MAALLLMNAAMLHQRIAVGRWLPISNLSEIKNNANVTKQVCREWERIMRHDFRAVLEPALEAVYAAENTGKMAGLEKALRHVAAAAQEIASDSTPTWAPTTPVPYSTNLWGTKPATALSSHVRWQRLSPHA